jgi:hypothetical protein
MCRHLMSHVNREGRLADAASARQRGDRDRSGSAGLGDEEVVQPACFAGASGEVGQISRKLPVNSAVRRSRGRVLAGLGGNAEVEPGIGGEDLVVEPLQARAGVDPGLERLVPQLGEPRTSARRRYADRTSESGSPFQSASASPSSSADRCW